MSDPHSRAAATETAASDAIPGTTIRFFLSSTFADFQVERDVLQRRVFPELRRLCAASGFRLQPIDLRWGVSEAAGTDRQTLRICFDELERCRQLSPDLFLLIQLGDRYGSYILPPELPTALVARLAPHLAPDEREAFNAAYRLDENAVPPEYVLLHAEGPYQDEDEQLRRALAGAGRAAGATEADRLLFEGSATHREIQLGLLGEPSGVGREAGVLCALRTFTGAPRGAAAERFVEREPTRSAQLYRLAAAVLDRLPAEQVLRYAVDWPDDAGPAFDEETLAAAYQVLLRPKLEAVIAARTAARAAAAARGSDEVALANAAFERERAARVEGRDAELAHIAAYLAGESGARLPLVVAGAAGSGKSTLLAEAATRAAATQPNATLVVRYVGVTPGTESLNALLNNVLQGIARAYRQPAGVGDENWIVVEMAAQLATLRVPPDRPLLLVVDALEQLSDRTQRTDWLPPRLAPHVRVVVSVLADRPERAYLSGRLPAEQVLILAPLGRAAGRAMLRDRLAAAPPRALTPAQEEAVLAAFAARGLPLHLRLLASEARRWRSFDPSRLGDSPLPEDMPELLQTILARLEAPDRSGRTLVARSLGDLAAARYGLAEDEMLDLLSRDASVREAQRDLSPTSPPIDPNLPLPAALWARLYAEVEPLLAERQAEAGVRLLTFYHRQLRAAVEARYLEDDAREERHQALADYFAGQPWRLGPKRWNWRKVRELVTQQERAGHRAAVDRTLSELADELARVPDLQAEDRAGIVALINALADHLNTGGYWRVGQHLYEQVLAIYRAVGDRSGEARLLSNLGAMARVQGRTEEAARYCERALAIFREVGDPVGEGMTLTILGELAAARRRPEEAARYYERALALRRAVADRAGVGRTLDRLGDLAAAQGRREEAARYYERALAIAREMGDRSAEGVTLNNLGGLAYELGRREEAARYYERALAIAREAGNRGGEGTTLNNLGLLAADQGRPGEAARYYEQALAIRREMGDRPGEGVTLYNLGLLAAARRRPEEAASYFEQALAIQREVGDRASEGHTLNNLGFLARARGRPEEAARYYERALAVYEAIGAQSDADDALRQLAALQRRRRQWPFGR